jgi:crotonobetainyl-CoA:carnitine CoA-transferase CaiB-like acyl-CoA transferase
MSGPLSDVRVLDLSQDVAGPYCARLMADFGADVIKVEPPGGEPGRWLPPFLADEPGPDRSAFFAWLNLNKRGISLNLDSTAGQALLRALVASADVVVESFAPGYLDGRRVGFDQLEAAKPGVILTSITPFGQTGPWRDREGNDLTAFALSGWAWINGTADREPLKGSGQQASFVAAVDALMGTLAALIHRDRHGVGQQVDVSVLEALTEIFGPKLLGVQHAGGADPRRERPTFFDGPVACKDGHFSLTLSRAHFWRDAMNELGLSEVANDDTFWSRRGRREELAAVVEPRLRQREKYDLFEKLSTLRVVSGMVLTTEELYANPHLQERRFFVDVNQPGLGELRMPGAPFKMSATPARFHRPAPALGEHTAEVLADLLGLGDEDVKGLRQADVV